MVHTLYLHRQIFIVGYYKIDSGLKAKPGEALVIRA